jgi:folate-binding protein YgfZ
MLVLELQALHQRWGARLGEVRDAEVVLTYGDPRAEHLALHTTVALLDLSFRGRLCVLGPDRERFLNGQTTNDVKALAPGQGCYTNFVTGHGRMEADANLYRLPDEFLLDTEPGCTAALRQRFQHHLVADDVEMADVAPHFGLLSVQGPQSRAVLARLDLRVELPAAPFAVVSVTHPEHGELYFVNQPRLGPPGWDLFAPTAALPAIAAWLWEGVRSAGGRLAGWEALETSRIEAGLPRFGADLDENVRPPEAGLESRAISYRKGCYVGQEVIARLRTYGDVAKRLCGLRLADGLTALPVKGDGLLREGREVGHITSAVHSPRLDAPVALGYVRRDHHAPGTELTLRTAGGESAARIVPLPFVTP